MNKNFSGRLQYARSYLAGLYDEVQAELDEHGVEVPPGLITTKNAISDAIDDLDRANRASAGRKPALR